MGMALLKRYQERGDYEAAVDIAEEVAQRNRVRTWDTGFLMFAALSLKDFDKFSEGGNKGRERRAKQDKPRTDNPQQNGTKPTKNQPMKCWKQKRNPKRWIKVQKIEPKVNGTGQELRREKHYRNKEKVWRLGNKVTQPYSSSNVQT